jgi:hypothetical protein
MQIERNRTGMEAGLTVWTDPEGRRFSVLVVKGTFAVAPDGRAELVTPGLPLLAVDEYNGEPGLSSIRAECDYSPSKPSVDLFVIGAAHAPRRRPVPELLVSLRLGPINKTLKVIGRRFWTEGLRGPVPSAPRPLESLPLVYEQAYGGSDHSHKDPRHHGTDLRNPVGVGFRKHPSPSAALGTLLPQIEYPDDPVVRWDRPVRPAGFGVVGRGWQPRIALAGTYDERWRDQVAPLLPHDFDPRYFAAAPEDQRLPGARGGEEGLCTNMTPDGQFRFRLPELEVPVRFRFTDRDDAQTAALDSITVQPEQRQLSMVWRARAPLGRKLTDLRAVEVGHPPARRPPAPERA